jgi:hypothetical protein
MHLENLARQKRTNGQKKAEIKNMAITKKRHQLAVSIKIE